MIFERKGRVWAFLVRGKRVGVYEYGIDD